MASNIIPFPQRVANDDDTPPSGGSPFIAALLAPLPATEVAAASDQFMQEIREDRRRPWKEAQLRVEALEAATQMHLKLLNHAYEFQPEDAEERSAQYHETKTYYMSFLHDLMMMPAPDGRAYRWKVERATVGGRHNDWNEVIDADIARLQRRAA